MSFVRRGALSNNQGVSKVGSVVRVLSVKREQEFRWRGRAQSAAIVVRSLRKSPEDPTPTPTSTQTPEITCSFKRVQKYINIKSSETPPPPPDDENQNSTPSFSFFSFVSRFTFRGSNN